MHQKAIDLSTPAIWDCNLSMWYPSPYHWNILYLLIPFISQAIYWFAHYEAYPSPCFLSMYWSLQYNNYYKAIELSTIDLRNVNHGFGLLQCEAICLYNIARIDMSTCLVLNGIYLHTMKDFIRIHLHQAIYRFAHYKAYPSP